VNSLLGLLRDFGIKELSRTGRIALTRGSSS
jgi:acetolactate synthase small subunit